jgi:hypothetical protein
VNAKERDTVPSPFDPLIEIIHTKALDSWKTHHEQALSSLFGSRYPKRAEKSVTLRAPEMKGGEAGRNCPAAISCRSRAPFQICGMTVS